MSRQFGRFGPVRSAPPVPTPSLRAAAAKVAGESVNFITGKAADIGARCPISEQADLCLTNDLAPKPYVELLTEKHLFSDAIRVLAYGLPKRDAVWWACLCLREALGARPRAKLQLALEAAENWARKPSAESRQAALQAAEAAGVGTSAGLTAMAAYWSGGSPAPPDAPAADLAAEGVAGAVLLTAAGAPPDEVPKRYRRFLALGLAAACGR